LEEFPVPLEGALVQARARFGPGGEIRGLSIASEPERVFEFLEPPEGYGGEFALIRLTWGEAVFFILSESGPAGERESWYDGEGVLQGFFETRLGPEGEILGRSGAGEGGEFEERRYYDSFGNLSELNGPEGRFSALYAAKYRPRYWKRVPARPEAPLLEPPPEGGQAEGPGPEEETAASPADSPTDSPAASPALWFAFQWNEGGLLVRITGDSADYRYDYTLDGRGNWTERRERRMVRRFGALAPNPGATVKRVIEYGR
jgi:hypothetical protein